MTDFSHFYNRYGAIYAVDFAEPGAQKRCGWPGGDLSLSFLCCKVLVADAELVDKATDVVNPPLFFKLLKAAFWPVQEQAIDILISKWPFERLVVSAFVADMLTQVELLADKAEMARRVRLGIKYSTCIVQSLMDSLYNGETRLRHLDLSGLPVAEIMVKYIASSCCLKQKEQERNSLIDSYVQNANETATLSSGRSGARLRRNQLKKSTLLPEEKLSFKLDCVVQDDSLIDELVQAFEAASSSDDHFSLQLPKLDLVGVGKRNIMKLLLKTNRTSVEAIRLQKNSLTEHSMMDLSQLISIFSNLKALDLSCNTISFSESPECATRMANGLARLVHLRRLNLSDCKLTDCLFSVLWSLESPLEYLGLRSCGLTEKDLAYLAMSMHTQAKHLDLGENRLYKYLDPLLELLRRCAPSIQALELDENDFESGQFGVLITSIASFEMVKLKILSTRDTVNAADYLASVAFLKGVLPSFLVWRISYPIDIEEEDFAGKHTFVQQMNNAVGADFKLKVSELFS